MPDDDSVTSFFVRFKQNVDAHIAAAFRSTIGIPSSVSKSMYVDGRWPETQPTAASPRNNASSSASRPHNTSSASGHRLPFDDHSIWSSLPMEFLAELEASAESMYQFAWMSFIINSPYSPLMLRHLPQPIPRDLPEGADASVFGFEDAFEDLLCVTSGQGLMDINDRYSTKTEWRQSFPRGLPPMLWLHQLTRQGLWDGWEPRPDFLEGAIRERWRRWLGDQDDPFRPREVNAPSRNTATADPRDLETPPAPTENVLSRSGDAEIEEELYELVEHGKILAKSVQAAVGSISKLSDLALGPETPEHLPTSKHNLSSRLPDGFREEVTTEERTEPNGYLTVVKTRVVFDEEDRPVSRMTETTTTRSTKTSRGTRAAQTEQEQNAKR